MQNCVCARLQKVKKQQSALLTVREAVNGCSEVELSPRAELDLLDGFWFYQLQGDGFGDYFLDSLSTEIDSLCIYAGVHVQPYRNSVYRSLAKRFPFAIYYCLDSGVATVLAVLDTRSSPTTIKNRLA